MAVTPNKQGFVMRQLKKVKDLAKEDPRYAENGLLEETDLIKAKGIIQTLATETSLCRDIKGIDRLWQRVLKSQFQEELAELLLGLVRTGTQPRFNLVKAIVSTGDPLARKTPWKKLAELLAGTAELRWASTITASQPIFNNPNHPFVKALAAVNDHRAA